MSEAVSKHSTESDEPSVSTISRFLAKLLRHNPEEFGISLNSRGWASVKDVRKVVNREFGLSKSGELIKEAIETDEKNRFQLISEDGMGVMRATRGHTANSVDLLEVLPDEEDLSWYLVGPAEPPNRSVFVEAVSEEAVKRILEERVSRYSASDLEDVEMFEVERDVYWNPEGQDSLSGVNGPNMIVHQHGQKPGRVIKRGNMATSDKGRYVAQHPRRVRMRLP